MRIKIHRNMRPFWKFGYNHGWFYNPYFKKFIPAMGKKYLIGRWESCGYFTLYLFRRSFHFLYSRSWYNWFTAHDCPDDFICKPFNY